MLIYILFYRSMHMYRKDVPEFYYPKNIISTNESAIQPTTHLASPRGGVLDADLAVDNIGNDLLDIREVVEHGEGDLLLFAVINQV